MRMPKLGLGIAAAVLGLAAGAAVAPPAHAAAGTATVTIVHGIPNTPVDVYANGKKILSGFTFKTVTSPLSLPAGSYTIDVRKAGAAASSAPVLAATEQVPAGANLTIVADLTAAGKPALTPFVNDTAAAGSARDGWSCGTRPPPRPWTSTPGRPRPSAAWPTASSRR